MKSKNLVPAMFVALGLLTSGAFATPVPARVSNMLRNLAITLTGAPETILAKGATNPLYDACSR